MKQKNKEESRTQIGVNAVNASNTKSSGFRMVCLEKPVLNTSLSALNHLRGDSMEKLDNSSYRFAGYKRYTFWVYNYLGKGVSKFISSCAVWKTRNE